MEEKTKVNKTSLQVFEVPASSNSITRWLERMTDLSKYTLLIGKNQGAYYGKHFISREENHGSFGTC